MATLVWTDAAKMADILEACEVFLNSLPRYA